MVSGVCSRGITVFLFTGTRPTPMLSFAVREKKAYVGIVITASHNPREYNGYKVYGEDGGQNTDSAADDAYVFSEYAITHILCLTPRFQIVCRC